MGLTGEQILREINAAQKTSQVKAPRPYLGMSGLARSCAREVWFNWRWFNPQIFSPRMERLLDRGHQEEVNIVYLLRLIGCKVNEIDPTTGEQYEFVAANGHVKGHCDGVASINGESFLLEIKTHNHNSFLQVKKANNLKTSKFPHFGQIQRYLPEIKLNKAIYCAINKNDDSLHFEVIKKDPQTISWLMEREVELVETKRIPKGISDSQTYWECKMCYHQGICFRNDSILKSCRSCQNSKIEPEGCWSCQKGEKKGILSLPEQLKGCQKHNAF
jgi:hypothetical protein